LPFRDLGVSRNGKRVRVVDAFRTSGYSDFVSEGTLFGAAEQEISP
jgi:hypothetical protein